MNTRLFLFFFFLLPASGQEPEKNPWRFSTETEGTSQPSFSQFLWGDYRKKESSRFGLALQGRRFDFGRATNRWEPSIGATIYFGHKKKNFASFFAGRTFEGRLAEGRLFTPFVGAFSLWRLRVVQVLDPKYPHLQLPGTLFRKTWVGQGRLWFRAEGLHVGKGIGTAFALWGLELRQRLPHRFHLYWASMYDSAQKNSQKRWVTIGGLRWISQ